MGLTTGRECGSGVTTDIDGGLIFGPGAGSSSCLVRGRGGSSDTTVAGYNDC